MGQLTPPVRRSQPKEWVVYLVVALLILDLFWKLAPAQTAHKLLMISPLRIGTPRISGTVVDAMTGRGVAGMNVCLLVTVTSPSFVRSGRDLRIAYSPSTQTDASGTFSFDRWDDTLDLFDRSGGYGLAVTDPAARWNQRCGSSFYLLGSGPDVQERAAAEHGQPDSTGKKRLPYFPAAAVFEPLDPNPAAYDDSSLSWLPRAGLLRKISDGKDADRKLHDLTTGDWTVGDLQNLTIPLIPLFADEKPCQSAQDSNLAELCREMNVSYVANGLRKRTANPSGGH